MSKPTTHESAVGHVTGRAVYADEQHPPQGLLSLYPVQAPHAHARILVIDTTTAAAMPGVVAVLTAADIPGVNNTGPIVHDEPVMPADIVSFHGQAVAWVVAEDEAQAAAAAKAVRVDYEALPPMLDVQAAIAANAFHLPPAKVERGDVVSGLANAPHRLHGELMIGGQDHFYLETQACWAQVRRRVGPRSTAKARCNSRPRRSIRARPSTWSHTCWAFLRTAWSAVACAWAAVSAARRRRRTRSLRPSPWPHGRPGVRRA